MSGGRLSYLWGHAELLLLLLKLRARGWVVVLRLGGPGVHGPGAGAGRELPLEGLGVRGGCNRGGAVREW